MLRQSSLRPSSLFLSFFRLIYFQRLRFFVCLSSPFHCWQIVNRATHNNQFHFILPNFISYSGLFSWQSALLWFRYLQTCRWLINAEYQMPAPNVTVKHKYSWLQKWNSTMKLRNMDEPTAKFDGWFALLWWKILLFDYRVKWLVNSSSGI